MPKKMTRVCLISGDYKYSGDGIGRYTRNLEASLESSGVTVENFGNVDLPDQPKSNSLPSAPKKTSWIIKKLDTELAYLSRFYRNNLVLPTRISKSDADVYHAVSPGESVSAILAGKRPLVTTIHDIIPLTSKSNYLFEKIYFNYYLSFAKKSDFIIADSYNTKEDLIEKKNFPEKKIRVIYPAVDLSKFKYTKRKPHSDLKILYLGGLQKRKGVYEVLYAFHLLSKKLKNIYLQIGGAGGERDFLEKEINRLGISDRVEMLGYVKESDLRRIYAQVDLFVYPSKYEGFGYTPVEAMASGVPVITSNSSSLPEAVGKAGILVNPSDIGDLADKMLSVLEDQDLREKMRLRGLRKSRQFGLEIFANKMTEIYEELLHY